MEKSGLSFENSLKFRTMRQQKHNSDNTLPSLYGFNVEKVETLSYLESILSTEASNNSTCFSGLTPRENFEKESNQSNILFYIPRILQTSTFEKLQRQIIK